MVRIFVAFNDWLNSNLAFYTSVDTRVGGSQGFTMLFLIINSRKIADGYLEGYKGGRESRLYAIISNKKILQKSQTVY